VQHVVEPRPFPHRRLASRVRAAAALPPPLAGALTGRSTATNRSQVRPIDDPHRMFAWPSPTLPPASWFPPSGPRGVDRGYICEDFKSLGSPAQEDSSLFCELVQHLVKSIKNRRKSKNSKPNFAVLSVTRTTTLSK
jgi:hypothetical protein